MNFRHEEINAVITEQSLIKKKKTTKFLRLFRCKTLVRIGKEKKRRMKGKRTVEKRGEEGGEGRGRRRDER